LAELPPEVLDRLAGVERVRVMVGPPGSNFLVGAVAAPIQRQLYLLLVPDPRVESMLDEHVHAAVLADDPGGKWLIHARGRMLYGRRVVNDPRRNELLHWLPEGIGPAEFVACRFHPEALDYQHDAVDGRRRANGPLPGGAPLPAWRRLWELGGAPFWPWLLAASFLEGLVILFVADYEDRHAWSLAMAILAGGLPVIGARIALAAHDIARWRKGLEKDAVLGTLGEAWFSARELERQGIYVLIAAAAAWILLGWACGAVVVGWVALVSGAPILVLLMAVRRRSTRPEEEAA